MLLNAKTTFTTIGMLVFVQAVYWPLQVGHHHLPTNSDSAKLSSNGNSKVKREPVLVEREPLVNRWKLRFENKRGGYVFFKHIRKASGTSIRYFLVRAMHYLKEISPREENNVVLFEQEASSMDWRCPQVDRRWNDSLSIISMRHPIERHLSEFYYHGPGSKNPILAKYRDAGNNSSSPELASVLRDVMPKWIEAGKRLTRFRGFGRYFSDNFMVRALSGTTSAVPMAYDNRPVLECAQFHQGRNLPEMPGFRTDDQDCVNLEKCPGSCDGPCQYGGFRMGVWNKWHIVSNTDLQRAIQALNSFDIVLLTEKINEDDQLGLLADFMGIPFERMSQFIGWSNARIKKNEENMYGYQDILLKSAPELIDLLLENSRFEMELYQHAIKINERLLQQWKEEKEAQHKAGGHSLDSSVPLLGKGTNNHVLKGKLMK